jgi:sugar phosphate isomerase/epimerase
VNFALSTHWNASRHTSGGAMLDEIAALGFDRVELGYDTRLDLVPGIVEHVRSGAMRVGSLHNICPVPIGAPRGHPEIFTLGSPDARERASAVHHTSRTLRFAAELGATVVVTHAGNVEMDHFSYQLAELCLAGRQYDALYEKLKLRCQTQRDKKAPKQIKFLRESLEQLKPVLAETGVFLAIENLPSATGTTSDTARSARTWASSTPSAGWSDCCPGWPACTCMTWRPRHRPCDAAARPRGLHPLPALRRRHTRAGHRAHAAHPPPKKSARAAPTCSSFGIPPPPPRNRKETRS